MADKKEEKKEPRRRWSRAAALRAKNLARKREENKKKVTRVYVLNGVLGIIKNPDEKPASVTPGPRWQVAAVEELELSQEAAAALGAIQEGDGSHDSIRTSGDKAAPCLEWLGGFCRAFRLGAIQASPGWSPTLLERAKIIPNDPPPVLKRAMEAALSPKPRTSPKLPHEMAEKRRG